MKKKITMETKIVNYFASTNAMLGNGGATMEIIKNRSITQCTLSNLDLSVTEEDLYDLFDEFFTLKSITMDPLEESKICFYDRKRTLHICNNIVQFPERFLSF